MQQQVTVEQRRLLIYLAVGAFMVQMDSRVIVPLLPAIASDLRVSIAQAAFMVTAYTMPYGLFQIAYGPLADRFGRLRVIVITMAIFAVGTFSCGLAGSLPLLDGLRFLTGGVAAATFPLALAYVGEVFPYHERQGAVGTLMMASAMAIVFSTAVGGIIANFLSWRAVFLVYGIAAAALVPILATRKEPRPQPGDMTFLGRYLLVVRNPDSRVLLPAVFFEGILIFGPFSFYGAYLADRFHLAVGVIGLLLAVYGLTTLTVSRMLGRLVRRFNESVMLFAGVCLVAASLTVVAFEPVWWLFPLAMVLNGTGYITCHTTLQTRATELAPSSRGTGIGAFAVALFLGTGIGTAVEGSVSQASGYTAMLLFCAAGLIVFGFIVPPALGNRRTVATASRPPAVAAEVSGRPPSP